MLYLVLNLKRNSCFHTFLPFQFWMRFNFQMFQNYSLVCNISKKNLSLNSFFFSKTQQTKRDFLSFQWLRVTETTYCVTENTYCVKVVQIRSLFWSVFSCIRTEYRKKRTKKNSVFGHFSFIENFIFCAVRFNR